MPGTVVSAARSSAATARRSASGREHGQHGQGQPGPDPAGRLQQLERVPLVLGGEAVEGQRVLPDDQRGRHPGPLAGAQPGQRARRALHEQPDPADVDHRAVGRHARTRSRPGARSCDPSGAPIAPRGWAASGSRRARRRWALRATRHRWQMARASASAASAGRGGSAIASRRVTICGHLRLVRPAAPGDRRLDLARRVQRHRQARGAPRTRSRPPPPAPCPSPCARCAG